jgi:Tfp pilus assembly protein PilX
MMQTNIKGQEAYRKVFSHKQRGFHLPVVLIILVAIVFSSTYLLHSVMSSQQEVQANLELLRAELSAQRAIVLAENAIDRNSQIPMPNYTLVPEAEDALDFSNGKVLAAHLEDYNLAAQVDTITGKVLNWWDQSETWWEKYAYRVDPDDENSGYYIIEFLTDMTTGEDYGQDRTYKGDGVRYLYRITARGRSSRGSAHLNQTSYTKVYLNE